MIKQPRSLRSLIFSAAALSVYLTPGGVVATMAGDGSGEIIAPMSIADHRDNVGKVTGRATYPCATVIVEENKCVRLAPLDSVLRQRFGVPDAIVGVVVTARLSNCPGESPLAPGDIIETVNGIRVTMPADVAVEAAKAKQKKNSVILGVFCHKGKCPTFM